MRARRRQRRARRGTPVWSSCSRRGKAEKRMGPEQKPLWAGAPSSPVGRRATRETADRRAQSTSRVVQGDALLPSARRSAPRQRERDACARMEPGQNPGAAAGEGSRAPAPEGGPPYGQVVVQYLEIRAEN